MAVYYWKPFKLKNALFYKRKLIISLSKFILSDQTSKNPNCSSFSKCFCTLCNGWSSSHWNNKWIRNVTTNDEDSNYQSSSGAIAWSISGSITDAPSKPKQLSAINCCFHSKFRLNGIIWLVQLLFSTKLQSLLRFSWRIQRLRIIIWSILPKSWNY